MTFTPIQADALRHFKRAAKLTIYQTSTPKDSESFFITRTGGPDGTGTNGIVITDLRMEFEVQHDLSKHPNSGSVKITNLALPTRAGIESLPIAAVLEAGYDSGTSTLFSGDVLFAMSTLQHPNWTTLVQFGDADRIIAGARLNRTYKSGTTYKTVLRDACASIGQELPLNLEQSKKLDKQLAHGGTVYGYMRDELTRILKPLGYSWSFQDGKLQVLEDGETSSYEFEISEATGMIGSPEFGTPPRTGKKPHVTINTLLYPSLRAGGRALVRARNMNGSFRIEKVKHSGDTHGQDWTTEIEVKPL